MKLWVAALWLAPASGPVGAASVCARSVLQMLTALHCAGRSLWCAIIICEGPSVCLSASMTLVDLSCPDKDFVKVDGLAGIVIDCIRGDSSCVGNAVRCLGDSAVDGDVGCWTSSTIISDRIGIDRSPPTGATACCSDNADGSGVGVRGADCAGGAAATIFTTVGDRTTLRRGCEMWSNRDRAAGSAAGSLVRTSVLVSKELVSPSATPRPSADPVARGLVRAVGEVCRISRRPCFAGADEGVCPAWAITVETFAAVAEVAAVARWACMAFARSASLLISTASDRV